MAHTALPDGAASAFVPLGAFRPRPGRRGSAPGATPGCPRQAFREQVPGLLERYQRRTPRLAGQLGYAVKESARRAGARLSRYLVAAVALDRAADSDAAAAAPAARTAGYSASTASALEEYAMHGRAGSTLLRHRILFHKSPHLVTTDYGT
ncbi:hypothetical protein AQJ91_42940 [Streptomyces dysideae]|uniref:Uncharacterized protein n=1 Tax=Streptomyces dysideae TaxID=909626 RepID=A0A101UQV3_9ACTN|nr:hypothetical protein AQJ91_42940 [Streptomyces dysideae]